MEQRKFVGLVKEWGVLKLGLCNTFKLRICIKMYRQPMRALVLWI